ncbi:hypothetical protein [Paraburkholderia sp. BL10I2N1]|uniref:hypothetical protein n=1 Tax=Paraburkholderia sp. BL10I2N1 TaxID=1938796 RepID=UPI00105F8B7E|nr:hypothetical protein [Paraburkholderia sp. BL10I2N1]
MKPPSVSGSQTSTNLLSVGATRRATGGGCEAAASSSSSSSSTSSTDSNLLLSALEAALSALGISSTVDHGCVGYVEHDGCF